MPAAKSKKRQFLKLMNSYSKKRQLFEKINASVQTMMILADALYNYP